MNYWVASLQFFKAKLRANFSKASKLRILKKNSEKIGALIEKLEIRNLDIAQQKLRNTVINRMYAHRYGLPT